MTDMTLTCRCGACALALAGPPILAAECHCTSCATAAGHFTDPVTAETGGTPYVLMRKDRVRIARGQVQLRALRLTPDATTRRICAGCCGTPLFLEFRGGHWLSVYAALWPEAARPAMDLRTMTADRATPAPLPDDIPNLRGHSGRFMLRLLGAWVAMGFRTPRLPDMTEEPIHAG